VQYIRRKQFKECFNGRDSVTKEIIGRCPCTAADYEWYVLGTQLSLSLFSFRFVS